MQPSSTTKMVTSQNPWTNPTFLQRTNGTKMSDESANSNK